MGSFMSPVPIIDNTRFVQPANKKKIAVKSLVRVDDTVVVEKEDGTFIVLQYNPQKSYGKAAYYVCKVWRNVEKILKGMWLLGRITKEELQKHFDVANYHEQKQEIKYQIERIDRFRKEFELTDAQYTKLVKKAEAGTFVPKEDLYTL